MYSFVIFIIVCCFFDNRLSFFFIIVCLSVEEWDSPCLADAVHKYLCTGNINNKVVIDDDIPGFLKVLVDQVLNIGNNMQHCQ